MRIRIILIAAALLGLLQPAIGQSLPGPATAPAMGQPVFRFAAIADPHIEKVETIENLRRFLYTMKDQPVDFLVILGDICDYMPDLLEQTGRVLRNSPLKVYAIPGNKDNDYGKDPDWYRTALGEPYYTFEHKGWRFVMYDSFDPPPDEWLPAQLSSAEPVIFCAHAPPDPRDLLTGKGPWGDVGRHDNVKIALAGHWHRRATGQAGSVTFEVLTDCFLRGKESPGTYYILDALPSGKVTIHEHAVADMKLREPPDAVPTVAIKPLPDGQVLRGTAVITGTDWRRQGRPAGGIQHRLGPVAASRGHRRVDGPRGHPQPARRPAPAPRSRSTQPIRRRSTWPR